jgi:hypothetical protein
MRRDIPLRDGYLFRETAGSTLGPPPRYVTMKKHVCCYIDCPEPGTIHIGPNGNSDTHWICFRHYRAWHDTRARFLARGLPCEMEELGELVCPEHFRR